MINDTSSETICSDYEALIKEVSLSYKQKKVSLKFIDD
jgi:hypothetical protein